MADGSSEKSYLDNLLSLPGLEIPVLTQPSQAFGLLLGKPDVNLFTYDLPDLEFTLKYDQFFPIIYVFGINVAGTLTTAVDLKFGYDTKGLKDFSILKSQQISLMVSLLMILVNLKFLLAQR